jgi:hypothetical protein
MARHRLIHSAYDQLVALLLKDASSLEDPSVPLPGGVLGPGANLGNLSRDLAGSFEKGIASCPLMRCCARAHQCIPAPTCVARCRVHPSVLSRASMWLCLRVCFCVLSIVLLCAVHIVTRGDWQAMWTAGRPSS